MSLRDCPNPNELSDLALGKLDIDQAALVADHLDACSTCATVMTQLSSDSDTIAIALKQLPYAHKYRDEPKFKEAIARAESVGMKAELSDRERGPSIVAGDPVPRFIRDYELLEKIGEGGMGVVYKARHTKLKRDVALKLLPIERLQDAEVVLRFEREMEAVGKLAHPNIISALDAGEVDGTHYLAMELVDGIDLSELVAQHGALPVADACELIRQAAKGLQRAHECGLVHRDIKPSNLMLTLGHVATPSAETQETGGFENRPTVKILDLGLALFAGQHATGERELTSTTRIMGTLAYMAPEQCANSHTVDIRADIYGLGATLTKMLIGKPPFSGERFDTPVKMMRGLVMEEPPPITSLRDDLPAELVAIIERMLAKDPADRYKSPRQVALALEPFATGHDLELIASQHTASGSHKHDTASRIASSTVDSRTGAPKASPVRRIPFPHWATIAAGAAPLILLFAGIVVVIRNPDGKVVAEIEVPERGSVEVRNEASGNLKGNEKMDAQAKAETSKPPPKVSWQPTPDQQVFFDAVRQLEPKDQVGAVEGKLKEINPDFDAKLDYETAQEHVVKLVVQDGWFPKLWPLAALENLTSLETTITPQTDLNALTVLPLEHLTGVGISPMNEKANVVVDSFPRLETINGTVPADWLARRQEIEEFVAAEIGQVVRKLNEYNPGFDGRKGQYSSHFTRALDRVHFEDELDLVDLSPLRGLWTLRKLGFFSTGVSDLSPLEGLPIRHLAFDQTRVADLSPLGGMPIEELSIKGSRASDLAPLEGMPIVRLYCEGTRISNLSPLKGAPLNRLFCRDTPVSDLSPLKGSPITHIDIAHTRVTDLAPLEGMSMEFLLVEHTRISDLSPLKGMPLDRFSCYDTAVSDFSPLKDMPLAHIWLDFRLFDDAQEAILKSLPLKSIVNGPWTHAPPPTEQFWEQVAAQRESAKKFGIDTAALPVETQSQVVTAQLKGVSGHDAIELETVVRDGAVAEATLAGNPLELTPLMAFSKLEKLTLSVGSRSKDMSPLTLLPLKKLTCPEADVLDNAAILRQMKTLETINGQPAGEYLETLGPSK